MPVQNRISIVFKLLTVLFIQHYECFSIRDVGNTFGSFEWSYHGDTGPEYWGHAYPMCDGDQQSPIDLQSIDDSTKVQFKPTLKFHNYDKPISGTILNNGHTIQVNVDNYMYIQHGGLSGKYRVAQFHFHWGRDNMHGSEHKREGKSYPLELHIVHYKEEYNSIAEALNYEDGLAVLGFLYRLKQKENDAYSEIVSKLEAVRFRGQETGIDGFTMEDLTFPDLKNIPYFRYQGSLSIPPCSQVVTWTVMMTTISINSDQLEQFRKCRHVTEKEAHHSVDDFINENYRPTQPLNDRTVFTSVNTSGGRGRGQGGGGRRANIDVHTPVY